MFAFLSLQASFTSLSIPVLSALYKKWMSLWWLVDLVSQSVITQLDLFILSLKCYHESRLDSKQMLLLPLCNVNYHISQQWDTPLCPGATSILCVAIYSALSELISNTPRRMETGALLHPGHSQASITDCNKLLRAAWRVRVYVTYVLSADGYAVTVVRYGLQDI